MAGLGALSLLLFLLALGLSFYVGVGGASDGPATVVVWGDDVPIRQTRATLESGDWLQAIQVQGSAPRFEVGGAYTLRGSYGLFSQEEALLSVESDGGRLQGTTRTLVPRDVGDCTFSFQIEQPGALRLVLRPAAGGEPLGWIELAPPE